ncbi:hypothetical protein HYC85_007873 [Camellia sinensis]|uniref:Uncharacterized protein n=1 Tax=Camellia sinensis TaxID=4442 RepID=A0A7J7HRK5_CAMSI|nr:hypothetical protein HYC85_007873 [Camellia sinensis]
MAFEGVRPIESRIYIRKCQTSKIRLILSKNNRKLTRKRLMPNILRTIIMEKENMVAEHWRNAKDSLLSLQRRNVDSMNSIVKGGVEANQVIRAWFSSVALSTMEEAIATNKSFLSSIDDLLKLDQDASKKINSLIATCREGVRETEITHFYKTIEIIQNAKKSLVNEYRVSASQFKMRVREKVIEKERGERKSD